MNLLEESKQLLQKGDSENAAKLVKQILNMEESWEAMHVLGSALYNLGKYPDAIRAFEVSLRLNATVETVKRYAWSLCQLRRFKEAINAFEQFCAYEEDWMSLTLLGNLYVITQQHQQAIDAYSQSLALHEDWDSYKGLGIALCNTKKYKQAIDAFSQSLARHEDWQSHNGLGWALYNTQQYKKAIEEFNQSIALHEDWDSYKGLGGALLKTSKYEQAIQILNKSLSLKEDWGTYEMVELAIQKRSVNREKKLSACMGYIDVESNPAINALESIASEITKASISVMNELSFLQRLEMYKTIIIHGFQKVRIDVKFWEEGILVFTNRLAFISKSADGRGSDIAGALGVSESLENIFIICTRNGTNYYHFIAECLPCMLLADIHLPRDVKFLYPSLSVGDKGLNKGHAFHKQLLETLLPDRVFINGTIDTRINVKNAYVSYSMPSLFYATKMLKSMSSMLDKCMQTEMNYDMVYIRRGENEGRKLTNEMELIELMSLSAANFLVLDTWNHPWKSQVEILRNAKVVVSSHGAQLTSCIFTKQLDVIVEIWPESVEIPMRMLRYFCKEYHWIKSRFENAEVSAGHRSDHRLSIGNIETIKNILAKQGYTLS